MVPLESSEMELHLDASARLVDFFPHALTIANEQEGADSDGLSVHGALRYKTA